MPRYRLCSSFMYITGPYGTLRNEITTKFLLGNDESFNLNLIINHSTMTGATQTTK
jgi:hypothetical protein